MKYFICVLIVIVAGCSGTCNNPARKKDLKVAKVNHKYQDVIEIKGGAVNESSVSVSIIPIDSGLAWSPEDIKYSLGGEDGVNKDYHRIIISGIPKNQVIIA